MRSIEYDPKSERVLIDPEEPVYMISVVSRLINLPIWTLRILDKEGIVEPKRTEGRTRLYSGNDLKLLIRIRDLLVQEKVNVQGIRIILEMRD
jgi:MerR family transcriptional regulator, heat shock protein HspR